ncbi:MAG TPA: BTAD domain-containing putative transcriptional regulator [Dongiaceae bacterium]|nr:BTAD domain-containing putative transcriptional regulator [Dongiaceae bacterium]
MARLQLTLLGGFEARIIPGEPLDIANRKTRGLLAYLALPTGRAHSRDKLTGLLWSDRGDEQARNSLRQALAELVRVLAGVEPAPLVKGRDTLALDPQAVEVDAIAFERLAASAAVDDLRHAMGLYAGELLDGFTVRDLAFDEWLRQERQRYERLAIATLKKLVPLESPANALAVVQRLATLAPLQEDGHRILMRLHAEAGNIGAALRQYEVCCDMLKRELAVGPSAETEALHRRIRESSHADEAMRPKALEVPPHENGKLVSAASAAPRLSVAVLPFRNLSDDVAQRYFSDGITEDITTELSRFRSLTVMARNSSFAFRDADLDITEVARKLGVQYVVEGSVRRMLDRVRITARLVDAETGSQLWSEHYDRETAEVFAIQDEIIQAIAATLPGRIEESAMRQARRKHPESLAAYDHFLRGLEHYLTMNRADEPLARQWFEKALALDPDLAVAHYWMAGLHLRRWNLDLSPDGLEQALAHQLRCTHLDPNNGKFHGALGVVRLYRKEFDEAAFQLERALALNPSDTDVMVFSAWLAAYRGRATEGLGWLEKAARLNPFSPPWFEGSKGMVLYGMRRYAQAAASMKRSVTPDAWELLYLVASLGWMGALEEVGALMAGFRAECPGRSLLQHAAIEPYENPADLEHLIDGLRKAGAADANE